jgi:hypothetical protein
MSEIAENVNNGILVPIVIRLLSICLTFIDICLELPDLPPILEWIPHVRRPEYVGLVVADAHHAGSIEVDVLDFLGAGALVYALLGLAAVDIEGLSAGEQLRIDEVVHLHSAVLQFPRYVLWY